MIFRRLAESQTGHFNLCFMQLHYINVDMFLDQYDDQIITNIQLYYNGNKALDQCV
jgi:hypothetical protein